MFGSGWPARLPEQGWKETLAALEGARHYLRRTLAERLNLFRVPELHFEADVELSKNSKVERLFKRIKRGRPRDLETPPQ